MAEIDKLVASIVEMSTKISGIHRSTAIELTPKKSNPVMKDKKLDVIDAIRRRNTKCISEEMPTNEK